MQRGLIAFALAVGMGVTWGPPSTNAQNVRDFTAKEPSSEELIDALKPQSAPPKVTGTRGIGAVPTEKPKCAYYRKQTSRGIKLKPDSDAAVLKITFASNSAQLTPESTQTLNKLGDALKSQTLAACCFQIEGHTDSKGSDTHNKRLSAQRARTVVGYLKQRFDIDVDRLLPVGHGESQPIADNESDEGREKNRRVQIVNLGYGQP